MPSKRLDFGVQKSGDHQLAGAQPLALNVVVDGAGAIRRRPCLADGADVPSVSVGTEPLVGCYADSRGNQYVVDSATPNRRVFRVDGSGYMQLTADHADRLPGSKRPTWAENEDLVIVVGGDVPCKVDVAGMLGERLGGSPPRATHVITNSQRILTNDLTASNRRGWVRYSGLGVTGAESWSDASPKYFVAEAQADGVVALAENSNEVFVFGTNTLQVYLPDASAVYAPTRTQNYGCMAPYSIVRVDNAFAWLTDRKVIVFSDGRSTQEISEPINGTLAAITTVSDCFAYRVRVGQFDCLLWCFPTDGRTFCYQRNGGWSQWHGWSDNNLTRFPVNCAATNPLTGVVVAGLTTGRVAQFSGTANDDLGTVCKAEARTGFDNCGTDDYKDCVAARLRFERGQHSSTTAPIARLSWRDDLGPFVGNIELSLGDAGDHNPEVEVRSLGVFKSRQWRVEFTGTEPFALASATIEFELPSD